VTLTGDGWALRVVASQSTGACSVLLALMADRSVARRAAPAAGVADLVLAPKVAWQGGARQELARQVAD